VKKVLRHLLIVLSFVMLLMCVATVWLWVRGNQGPDVIHYTSENNLSLTLISGHGTIDVCVIPRWPQEAEFRYSRYDRHVWYGTRYSYKNRFLGFGRGEQWPEYGGWYVNIPNWFIATMSGGAALLLARMWWKRRPRAVGRCPGCGYDMRATPERCPECGRLQAGSAESALSAPAK
jgi:hypothetical protein